jgi:hypothetical protein
MATYNANTELLLTNNQTLHETSIGIDKHGNLLEGGGSFEFLLNVARGRHPDITFEHKSGYIQSNFSNGDTVWDNGSPYPWSAFANTEILYVDSATNNENDRGLPIIIVGLDASYNVQTEEVILDETNSTTPVATTKQFKRINNVYVNNGITNESDITVRVTDGSGTLVEIIPAGFGRSMTSVYTVPAGYTGYLLKGSASTTTACVVGFYIKYFGEGFKLQHVATADNTQYDYNFPIPLPFPEKTDMDVRGIIGSGRCAVNWDMLLYKNN